MFVKVNIRAGRSVKRISTTAPKKVRSCQCSLQLLFQQLQIGQQVNQIHRVTGLVVWRKESWRWAVLQSRRVMKATRAAKDFEMFTIMYDWVCKEYTGLTATAFKQRFYNHQQSLRDARYQNSTALSKYVWSLKSNNVNFSIKWSIHKKARAYNNAAKRCDLCLAEKLATALAEKGKSLNRRSEFVSKCRHENKFYLRNYPPSVD